MILLSRKYLLAIGSVVFPVLVNQYRILLAAVNAYAEAEESRESAYYLQVPVDQQHKEVVVASTSRLLNVMIVAAYPYDLTHAVALWTTLECLYQGVDKVYLAAPDVAQDVVDQFVDKARASLVSIDIEVHYFRNDRYDIGLWCDLMSTTLGLPESRHKYSTVQLINDSIFLLRPYSGIRDALVSNETVTVTSLNEAETPSGQYWIERYVWISDQCAMWTKSVHSCSLALLAMLLADVMTT
jgi:hypothetical protein